MEDDLNLEGQEILNGRLSGPAGWPSLASSLYLSLAQLSPGLFFSNANACLIHPNKLLTFQAFIPKSFIIPMQDFYIFLTKKGF
jgi:hypothetical protein